VLTKVKIDKDYKKNGYVIVKCYSKKEYLQIKKFIFEKVYKILKIKKNLKNYHLWNEKFQINHDNNFKAKNRFFNASKELKKTILNKNVKNVIKTLIGKNKIWRDKRGLFSFRIIRPGLNDGYPYSCKEWGPAKKVLSMWVPILGNTKNETLKLLPKSHKIKFKKYLPKKSKFQKEEFRLVDKVSERRFKRLDIDYCKILFYHPKLIHSENVEKSKITRINLEFRANPET